jgi:hypothetical protein
MDLNDLRVFERVVAALAEKRERAEGLRQIQQR